MNIENLRDGFEFEPIHIQAFPAQELSESGSSVKEKGKYRILDGAHRWSAYKKIGKAIDRIAKRLGVPQQTISRYLPKMPALAKWVNSSPGFSESKCI